MNTLKNTMNAIKTNRKPIIKGAAIVLGATVGLAIGMELMSDAADTLDEAIDSSDDAPESSDD